MKKTASFRFQGDLSTFLSNREKRRDITDMITPFHRYLRCNALLRSAEKEHLLPRLQPLTRQYFEEFQLCPVCIQIYWKGSHYDHMLGLIDRITERLEHGS